MTKQKLIFNIRENWKEASLYYNFKIYTPFKFCYQNQILEAFAYLPEYGSPNGMIVELTFHPDFIISQEIVSWCRNNEVFYSFINANSYSDLDLKLFSETLVDWGRYPIGYV